MKTSSFRVENIQPILRVGNMAASRKFYVDILGFEEADWGSDDFTAMMKEGGGIYLCKGSQGNAGTWIWVGFDGDIFALRDSLKKQGVKIRLEPTNFSYAYEMHIEDPDGHIIRFGTDPDETKPFVQPNFS